MNGCTDLLHDRHQKLREVAKNYNLEGALQHKCYGVFYFSKDACATACALLTDSKARAENRCTELKELNDCPTQLRIEYDTVGTLMRQFVQCNMEFEWFEKEFKEFMLRLERNVDDFNTEWTSSLEATLWTMKKLMDDMPSNETINLDEVESLLNEMVKTVRHFRDKLYQ